MADLTRRPGPGGDPMQRNPEENPAQARSDATQDEGGDGRDPDWTQQSDRADGRGSDANGIPEFDETEGQERKKLYERTGSPIVSRID
ncbi:MAG TPA: hypothetical protein VNR64_17855 [Vicinamibacterales bacterium]|nr:hypothetical protein [Vicinamibacterales bacterium]